MTTPTRIYTVTDNATGKARLVKAAHADRALRHAAQTTFAVRVASQDDIANLVAAGTAVEVVGIESTAAAPAPPPDGLTDDRTLPLDGVPLP